MPPVIGIVKAEEFDCELGSEEVEEIGEPEDPPVEGSEVGAGGVDVSAGGVTVTDPVF